MKNKAQTPPSSGPHCREHSCPKRKVTAEGYCKNHRSPANRHHDRRE